MNSDIEKRVERLERANRRFRYVIIVIIMLVPTMAAVQRSTLDPKKTTPPDQRGAKPAEPQPAERDATTTGRTLEEIRRDYEPKPMHAAAKLETDTPRRPLRIVDAEVFAVVDGNQSVRAEIGVDDGIGYLRMYDRSGNRRIELLESGGSTTLRLLDATGISLVELRQTATGAQISLGTRNEAGKSDMQLISDGSTNGVYLSGSKPNQDLSLELDRDDGPQLNLTGAKAHAHYRSNGLHVGSDAGGLNFYLTPGKHAALSFSACAPVAGQEGVALETSPESASLNLKSLKRGSNANLSVMPDATILNLKPSTGEAVAQWSIRDCGTTATANLLMRSNRGEESIQIALDEKGPEMHFFNTKGESVQSKRPQETPSNSRPNK